jgi:hypothetical protein
MLLAYERPQVTALSDGKIGLSSQGHLVHPQFSLLVVLGVELRASYLLGKCSTT